MLQSPYREVHATSISDMRGKRHQTRYDGPCWGPIAAMLIDRTLASTLPSKDAFLCKGGEIARRVAKQLSLAADVGWSGLKATLVKHIEQ